MIKPDDKYWILSIPFWLLLVSIFIYWRMDSDKNIQSLEKQYWTTVDKQASDYDKWKKLDHLKKQERDVNQTFIYAIGLLTLTTLGFQIIGRIRTGRRVYRCTTTIFWILLIAYLILFILMGIVPSTGFVS